MKTSFQPFNTTYKAIFKNVNDTWFQYEGKARCGLLMSLCDRDILLNKHELINLSMFQHVHGWSVILHLNLIILPYPGSPDLNFQTRFSCSVWWMQLDTLPGSYFLCAWNRHKDPLHEIRSWSVMLCTSSQFYNRKTTKGSTRIAEGLS